MVELVFLLIKGLVSSFRCPEFLSAYGLEGTYGFLDGLATYVTVLLADWVMSRHYGVKTYRHIFGSPLGSAWIYAALSSLALAPVASQWDFAFRGPVVYLGALLIGGLIISMEEGFRR